MSEKPKKGVEKRAKWLRAVRRATPALIVIAALAGVVLIAVVLKKRDDDKPVDKRPPVNVETEVVRPMPEVLDTFEIVGRVEADRVAEVSAEAEGRVEQVFARKGRPVRAGEKIIRLNTDILQAEYNRAKAQKEFNDREYNRISLLHKKGAATDNEAEQARTQARISEAVFSIAKARLDRAVIVAPIDGTLDDVIPKVGTLVKSGDVVAVIVDMDPAKVVVDVPECDVSWLKDGDKEEIIVKNSPDSTVSGRISYISKRIDLGSNTTRVEISADNRDGALWSGQIVHVRLLRRKQKNVIMVPLEALIPLENGKKVVYVVESGKAVRREVQMDLTLLSGQRVCIRSGLKDGDRLIVKGQRFVSPESAVREKDKIGPATQAASQPTTSQAATKPAR